MLLSDWNGENQMWQNNFVFRAGESSGCLSKGTFEVSTHLYISLAPISMLSTAVREQSWERGYF